MLIDLLRSHSRLTVGQLEHLAASASSRYKTFSIKKRDGSDRTIEQPSRIIKALQRWLTHTLIEKYPVHHCSTAYNKGCSIKSNAERHARTNFTLRIDFKDFFPSFKGHHIEKFFSENYPQEGIELDRDDLSFIRRIVTRHDALTIGAPTSPHLTNIMMFRFDTAVEKIARESNLIYTRYADDLFLSSMIPNKLEQSFAEIEKLVQIFPFAHLSINREKTAFLSRKYHRSITGIVITPTGELSLGRERKIMIKKALYSAKLKGSNFEEDEKIRLRGYLAFANDVEATFVATLKRKYGSNFLEGLLSK